MLKTGLRVKEETKDHLDSSGPGEQVNDSAIHQEKDYERKRRIAITVRHPTIDGGNQLSGTTLGGQPSVLIGGVILIQRIWYSESFPGR